MTQPTCDRLLRARLSRDPKARRHGPAATNYDETHRSRTETRPPGSGLGRSVFQQRGLLAALLAACLLLLGCQNKVGKGRESVLAEAYAGPVTLVLRTEISPKSPAGASAKHGDKLEVLQVRRRFVRVRTPSGQEGWTEIRNLLGPEQMDALGQLAKRALKLPSQGEATVFTTLNVHSEPSRTSTSFYQLTEGKRADVVGHLLVPVKDTRAEAPFKIEKPKPRVRKPKPEPKIATPPRPAAPSVPSNWQELSKTSAPVIPEALIAEAPKGRPKVRIEDWSLIRMKDGKAGWVLTRNLVMAIPDEVAQYSEGARISSYFALKDVHDGEQTRHHWLWTTMRDTAEPFDFDSFRIFTYMLRRHRYETAYIERRVEGYYPVKVSPGEMPKFSLITRNDAGNLIQRTFVLEGYNVRKVSEEPYQMKAGTPGATIAGTPSEEETSETGETPEESRSKSPSMMDRVRGWFGKK